MNNFSNKVYILTEQNDVYDELLNNLNLPDLRITLEKQEATILLAAPPLAASQLDNFPQLEWLQSIYAGVDALIDPDLNKDYILTNVKGIFGQQISEYVIGYSIQFYRDFNAYRKQEDESLWTPHQYSSLNNKIMVILGTGAIGQELAEKSSAMGITAWGVNRTGIPPKNASFTQTFHIHELGSALKRADILVNTLPSTPETKNIINAETLSHCHNTLLFNVGRGDALVERELSESIRNGNVAHAFLDVFVEEPLPKEHSFWQNESITITPHVAALSFPEQVVKIFADNYVQWRDGFSLNNQIDFDKGY